MKPAGTYIVPCFRIIDGTNRIAKSIIPLVAFGTGKAIGGYRVSRTIRDSIERGLLSSFKYKSWL